MMKRVAIFSLALCLLFSFGSLWADDYNPPERWIRGDPGTTYQRWEFMDGGALPSAPEEDYINPFGPASLTITDEGETKVWMPSDGEGHEGVWRYENQIIIEILNFNEDNPLKEIWIQLTYAAIGVPLVYADDPGGTRFWGQMVNEEPIIDSEYLHATWHIIMEPNPDREIIFIEPRNCTTYIDEIVIDTICIPEPATLLMLGLGGLALLKKRRA
jgi:hypothetical protein